MAAEQTKQRKKERKRSRASRSAQWILVFIIMDHTSQTKGLAAAAGGQKYLTPPPQSDDQSSRPQSHNKTVNANKSRLNNSTFLSNWYRIHSINGSPETNTTLLFLTHKINISAARVRYLLLHISTFMADHDHLLSQIIEWNGSPSSSSSPMNIYRYIYTHIYIIIKGVSVR